MISDCTHWRLSMVDGIIESVCWVDYYQLDSWLLSIMAITDPDFSSNCRHCRLEYSVIGLKVDSAINPFYYCGVRGSNEQSQITTIHVSLTWKLQLEHLRQRMTYRRTLSGVASDNTCRVQISSIKRSSSGRLFQLGTFHLKTLNSDFEVRKRWVSQL